jgi:hypothetical protein
MATGPWHYRAAEIILDGISQEGATPTSRQLPIDEATAIYLAWAQAHATLALAAATALYDADFASGAAVEYQAWRRIAGSEVTP